MCFAVAPLGLQVPVICLFIFLGLLNHSPCMTPRSCMLMALDMVGRVFPPAARRIVYVWALHQVTDQSFMAHVLCGSAAWAANATHIFWYFFRVCIFFIFDLLLHKRDLLRLYTCENT